MVTVQCIDAEVIHQHHMAACGGVSLDGINDLLGRDCVRQIRQHKTTKPQSLGPKRHELLVCDGLQAHTNFRGGI